MSERNIGVPVEFRVSAHALRDRVRQPRGAALVFRGESEFAERWVGELDPAARLDCDMQPKEAWPQLLDCHDRLVAAAGALAAATGSAEWLWMLRRLRGQFHLNHQVTTDPYVQSLAECLASGFSRPSDHPSGTQVFEFATPDERLIELGRLREAAMTPYELHGVMKRCAKGLSVRFTPGRSPQSIKDRPIELAIRAFDRRNASQEGSLLRGVGLALSIEELSAAATDTDQFASQVLGWFHTLTRPGHIVGSDPAPTVGRFIDLARVVPPTERLIVSPHQAALIALLWTLLIGAPENDPTSRLATAFQWGYFLPRSILLTEMLDAAVKLMREDTEGVIDPAVIPQDGEAARAELAALEPTAWPP